MLIIIKDQEDRVQASIEYSQVIQGQESLQIKGTLPGGLQASDLRSLGYIYYETSERGEILSRVKDVPLEESLAYIRALQDALPPGYYIASVSSPAIEAEQQKKRRQFERELTEWR